MSLNEYKTQLLRGKPIRIDFFSIIPLTLDQIFEMGEPNYQRALSALFFDVSKIDLSESPELEQLDKFLLFSLVLQQEEVIRTQIHKSLKLFTNIDFNFSDGVFMHEGNILTEEHWVSLRKILGFQNNVKEDFQEKAYNPKSKRAQEMQRKIEETRKQVQKIKEKQDKTPHLCDLISGLCAKHPSINLINVWNLTYYQFVDQLERLQIVEEYEFALSSLLAAVDSKKVKIRHSTTKN